jgi:pilus assembly protein FimV
LRSQLAASQENLDKAILDNEELQAEKASIQEQLESLQHLLKLKNDQLAALQAAAVQDSEEKEPIETQTAEVATTAEETTDGDQLAPAAVDAEVDKAEIETKPPEAEVVAEVKKPDSAAAMKREQPRPESTLSRQLMDNAAYIGGGLLALLLALGGILLKRRAAAAEEEAAAILAEEDESTEPDFDNEQEDGSEDFDELAETEDDYEEDEDDESPSTTQSETGDAIGEADIYVAYGRFQHAIDLLKNAISSEPQRSDLRVKLLEVYLEAEDQQGFQQQFVELQTLGDEDAIGQVKEMLSSVDGASDWLDNVSAAEPAESEAMAFDEAVEDSEFLEEDDADIELDLGEIDEEEASDLIEYDLEGIDLGTKDSKPEVEVAAVAQEDVLDDSQSMDDGFELDLVEEEPIDSLDFEESLDESGLGLELGDEDSEGLVLEDDGSMELGEDLTDSVVEELAEESDMELEVGEDLSDFDDLEEDLLETETDELAAVDELDVDLDLGDDLEGFDAEDLDAEADELDEHLAEGDDLAVDDDEFEFLSDADEVATKLDLARAYIDMGDVDGARDILEEVLQEGEEEQKSEANELLKRIV